MYKVIGLDIGGTQVKGAVLDAQGKVYSRAERLTEASRGRDYVLCCAVQVIRELLASEQTIAGIGIASAGRIDVTRGTVVYATENLPGWQGLELEEQIGAEFGLPVCVDNDANAALLGELWLGVASTEKPVQDVVMLTLGTGVGGANYIAGHIQRGHEYFGGEWGHVLLRAGGKLCNCGRRGCAEQYLSGTALLAAGRKALGRHIVSGAEIFAKYPDDGKIQAVVQKYLSYLAQFIASIDSALNPEIIVLGGGVLDSQAKWWADFQDLAVKYLTKTLVCPAQLGNRAGFIGAAKMMLDNMQQDHA